MIESWSDEGHPFFFVLTRAPITVTQGDAADLEIAYVPTEVGEHRDRITLSSNAREPARLEVRGHVAAGTLACAPSDLDIGGVLRGSTAAAVATCVSTGALRFLGAELDGSPRFEIGSAPPPGARATGSEVAIDVVFRSDGPQADHEAVLVLRYENAAGAAEVRVQVRARVLAPDPGATDLSAFVFWDTDLTDVDLHLVRPGGAPFAAGDCYAQQPAPDWGAPGDTSDDPFLDRDDFDGRGPENINLTSAGPGSYEVFVHYYADNRIGGSTASVEIHAGGVLFGVLDRLLACDDLWHVGTITWDGTAASLTPGAGVEQASRGLCF